MAVVVALGALGYAAWAAGARPLSVALVHQVNSELDSVSEDGFEEGVSAFDLIAKNRVYDGLIGANELRSLSAEGVGLIIVPGALLDDWQPVIQEHPNTHYILSFPYDAPNVSYFTSADEEGSFLVGAAAAAKTKTGVIGFLGGLDADFIWTFEAGFEAGARAVDPDIKILKTYLATDQDYGGAFDNPLGGRTAARQLYEQGADIVFHAAGKSGMGLLEAARHISRPDRQLWAIGVDTDEFMTVDAMPGVVDSESLRPHILTSMLKRLDVGTTGSSTPTFTGNCSPAPIGWTSPTVPSTWRSAAGSSMTSVHGSMSSSADRGG